MNEFPKNNQEVLLWVQKYPLIINFLLTITDLSEIGSAPNKFIECQMQNQKFKIWKSGIDYMLRLNVAENNKQQCSFNPSQLTYLFENKNKLEELINFI